MLIPLDFYSVWPSFVCLAVLLALVATPLFAAAETPPSPRPNRLTTLDGLRGFPALAAVFHHIAVYHDYLLNGQWHLPPSRFYSLLGRLYFKRGGERKVADRIVKSMKEQLFK
jgi:hypothetical protein